MERHTKDNLGREEWFDKNDDYHRDGDLPARIYNGDLEWYRHGKRHRSGDNPAVIYTDGFRAWWKNGLRHRDVGPAIIYGSGLKKWYQYGVLHRNDGPAIVAADGYSQYYINDTLVDRDTYEHWQEEHIAKKIMDQDNPGVPTDF